MKQPKAVKAWAVIDENGKFSVIDVFTQKSNAEHYALSGCEVIPVLITPIVKKKRARIAAKGKKK